MFDMGFDDANGASSGLESMYQEVILDAARNPHGKTHFLSTESLSKAEEREEQFEEASEKSQATDELKNDSNITITNHHENCAVEASKDYVFGESHQFNPTCGDEVTMHVELAKNADNSSNALIKSIKWDGHGCSISQASLSIMVDLVEGKTVADALRLAALFHKLMESRGVGLKNEQDEDDLEDAMVFQGVSKYPMRIKCALLAWEGLKDGIAKAIEAL
ncbi:SUF system NifU family Fe-S cluster assembly protein [Bifidobacteriaceae bacterium NR026]|nr:SUF system NifU family Fe-S cluster assembly protein [Bifidobacteriaceae bacterium NR026]